MSQKTASATGGPTPAPGPVSKQIRIVLTACTILATLMQGLDGTIANVALPYMQGSMSASQEEINWVLTSYLVASAIMTTPTGFLAMRFGRTRSFVVAILAFTATSVLCGVSQSLDEIVFFRVLQGMCGAMLVPLSQAILLDIYPIDQRGRAMSIWTTGVMVGPIIGPTLGGWLTDHYSWRWVFYVNVPFGLLAAAGLVIYLKETARNAQARMDWLGFGSLSLAIGALQMMLDRGETLDWFSSPEIITEACLAGISFYIFLVQISLAKSPFISPRVFADRNFVVSLLFVFIMGALLYATLALLAPYLQIIVNYPVTTAGLVLAPRGVGSMVAALLCGRLLGVISARMLVGIGFAISAYVQFAMAYWTPDISEATIVFNGLVQGVGISFITVPMATIGFATLANHLRTEATGIFSLVRNMGSAIGISVTSALLQTNTQINHASIAAVVTPFYGLLHTGAGLKFWNPASPAGAAALDAEITRQAAVIGYSDDFKLMFILTLFTLPLILLIRPARLVAKTELPQQMEPALE